MLPQILSIVQLDATNINETIQPNNPSYARYANPAITDHTLLDTQTETWLTDRMYFLCNSKGPEVFKVNFL